MCSLDVSNSATRANAISRFLLVSLDVDAILAEATIHKMSTPIVPINPADPALAGCRSGKAIVRAGRYQPGRSGHFDQTSLSWAAMNRHGGILKLLLGRKMSTKSSSKSGRTPLTFATAN